jgi:hypothetical protein
VLAQAQDPGGWAAPQVYESSCSARRGSGRGSQLRPVWPPAFGTARNGNPAGVSRPSPAGQPPARVIANAKDDGEVWMGLAPTVALTLGGALVVAPRGPRPSTHRRSWSSIAWTSTTSASRRCERLSSSC